MVAIDNKIEQAMVSCSAAPPRTFPRHHAGAMPGGGLPAPGWVLCPGRGVPLPTGVPTPHSAARQSCSLSATAATLIGSSHSAVRRERGWTWRGTLGVWG